MCVIPQDDSETVKSVTSAKFCKMNRLGFNGKLDTTVITLFLTPLLWFKLPLILISRIMWDYIAYQQVKTLF